ncbi:TRAP transporter small permease [Nitrogeniibacter mangrovi]|uniref:TRAP transporter small permease protein n=1 Tax=Nitrogeniibacter mangrovi TaxID=2016596 RepID=A0A6C1B421_9RHOO|nr:TRAP transporter small permease [Nitrogeniibacter mangrovi]QID18412.1 TRAP transporter small permease [Nitrogeniibacter mangrovi]
MIRRLDRVVGAVSTLCFAASTLLVCANVFYRYAVLGGLRHAATDHAWVAPIYQGFDAAFSLISGTADELPGLLLVWIAFLGGYLALREGKHISFDLLVDKLPSAGGRFVCAMVALSVAVFLGVVLVEAVRMIRSSGATEIETAEIAQGWFMAAVPVAAGLMIVAILWQIAGLWRGRDGEGC